SFGPRRLRFRIDLFSGLSALSSSKPPMKARPMKTALCQRLGIELPIIQAPMGGAAGPILAAAVSNAGGLGTLPLWRTEVETLRRRIRDTGDVTSRPFAA